MYLNCALLGEKYSVGDVLLEIETDKAQMDVEAQDDGIMAKIIVQDGSKGIAVGTRIAILAEDGDDIATLDIPPESKQASPEPVKKDQTSPPAKEKAPTVEASASRKHPQTARPQNPSPSVMNLFRANGISKDDGDKIAGTGPKGRLLKGDILAYLGKIDKSAPGELEAKLEKLEKLDLSNIKIAPSKKPAPVAAKKALPPAAAAPKESEVNLSVNFAEVSRVQEKMQKTLGVHLPLSTFLSKATAAANAALPPKKLPPSADELFNDILGLPNAPRRASKGSFAPVISPLPSKGIASVEVGRSEPDIYDVLTSSASVRVEAKKVGGPREGIIAGGENLLTLKVPSAEEERAKVFLGRVKGLLEQKPGELVL
jgi:hypothetical protein